MVQYQKLQSQIIRYLIFAILIFVLVVFVPNSKLSFKDTTVLTIILTLVISIIEVLTTVVVVAPENFDEIQQQITPTPEQNKSPKIITDTHTTPNLNNTPIQPPTSHNTIKAIGSREKDDVITDDMPYTDYNHLPMADMNGKSAFEFGYSFLPPEKWYPTPPFPPVCVTEKKCNVCPTFTEGTPVDAKEWNQTTRITPPDRINTDFVEEKLNSGR